MEANYAVRVSRFCIHVTQDVQYIHLYHPAVIGGAGATTSSACTLCQPGTYQTGSGQIEKHVIGLWLLCIEMEVNAAVRVLQSCTHVTQDMHNIPKLIVVCKIY